MPPGWAQGCRGGAVPVPRRGSRPPRRRPSAGGKNKSVELEDVKFHQCVRLSRFDSDRTISFVPPDGDFELMSYRLGTRAKPLIWIESVIEKFSHSRVEIMVKVRRPGVSSPPRGPRPPVDPRLRVPSQAKAQFKKQSVANGVEIAVPVPSDADSPKFKTSVGSARYLPEKNLVVWSIKSFPVRPPARLGGGGTHGDGSGVPVVPMGVSPAAPCRAGGQGAPDARPLRAAQRGEGGR